MPVRTKDYVTRSIMDETYLIDIGEKSGPKTCGQAETTGEMYLYTLNEAAAETIKLVDGKRDVGGIVDKLYSAFKKSASKEQIMADTLSFLNDMLDTGVIKVRA